VYYEGLAALAHLSSVCPVGDAQCVLYLGDVIGAEVGDGGHDPVPVELYLVVVVVCHVP